MIFIPLRTNLFWSQLGPNDARGFSLGAIALDDLGVCNDIVHQYIMILHQLLGNVDNLGIVNSGHNNGVWGHSSHSTHHGILKVSIALPFTNSVSYKANE